MIVFSKIASFFLGLVAIAHLLRIIYGMEVLVGTYQIPMWMSYVAFIVTLILCVGLCKEACNKNSEKCC
jgi:uncharacterized membrane protein YhdT